jgi:hypothetical protein
MSNNLPLLCGLIGPGAEQDACGSAQAKRPITSNPIETAASAYITG